MQRKVFNGIGRLLFAAVFCFVSASVLAKTEINVETAGTLSSLLTSTDRELKVTGVINGTDIKYIRSLVTAGTVIMGKGMTTVAKGAFYESKVKDVYVKALTPPSTSSYMFSSNPTIHVYASALSKYKASDWKNYGTIVGDLDEWEAARTTGVVAPEISAPSFSSGEGDVYDLSGRRVNSQLKKGLYIVGGKKWF